MNRINIYEILDDNGYCIGKIDGTGELSLVKMNGDNYDIVFQSKFRRKLIEKYKNELKTNKVVISNMMDLLEKLTIEELRNIKSFYNIAIELKIKEIEERYASKAK